MITAFLLLPVLAVLGWLYWYLLPGGRTWRAFDSVLLAGVIGLAALFIGWIQGVEFEHGGPRWANLISVVGAYAILAGGLAMGLAWRRR